MYCFPAGELAQDVVKSLVTSVICSTRPHLIPQNYYVDPDSSCPGLDPEHCLSVSRSPPHGRGQMYFAKDLSRGRSFDVVKALHFIMTVVPGKSPKLYCV